MKLPNIKRQFIPDPGYIIVDADLSGADAQVVAWESNDEAMKLAFRKGLKVHIENVKSLYPKYKNKTGEEIRADPIYHNVKQLAHATNYVGQPPTISKETGRSMADVKQFQKAWFELHPGIKEWHIRTSQYLTGFKCYRCNAKTNGMAKCPVCETLVGRKIKNAFGYTVTFYEDINTILPKAVAWVPQSTIATVTKLGLILLDGCYPDVKPLLQVHDSLVFQIPKNKREQLLAIKKDLDNIVVPYKDPLKIPWEFSISEDRWSDCI